MTRLIARKSSELKGETAIPGDKSVSHRALMLGAMSVGETKVSGLLEGEDVLATAAAVSRLGARVDREGDGAWRILGRGVGGLTEPSGVLDFGNSGTGARLLMGVVATHSFTSTFTGDASLSSRPMERVMAPLRQMGARFSGREGGRLPITVEGAPQPMPIEYELPVASAQVKSAVLLAGLNAPGETTVLEPHPSRDHTERMLRQFGADVTVVARESGGNRITVVGQPELEGCAVVVPADVSSAAFPIVAALLVPGSRVRLASVGTNPLRAGLLTTLADMGADIEMADDAAIDGEPISDLTVSASMLRGVRVPAERAPSMIDEYPVLAMAAACADGTTVMEGLAELRVKESDRLDAVARGLEACGVEIEETPDSLKVHGTGRPPKGGAAIDARLDHRIAMAFLVLGLAAEQPIAIEDASPIETSFPGFAAMMAGLGADLGVA